VSILITGAAGQLGQELTALLAPVATLHALDRRGLDLGDPAAIRSLLRTLRPSVVINCAAYTAVDAAESDAETAQRVNAEAPGIIAAEARALGARLIHCSTDFVFDGRATRPYVESDPTAPLSVYGRSKRDGELAVLAADPSAVVLRLAWVYGAFGKNFVSSILGAARAGRPLRVVEDQVGSPTWARAIATAIGALITEGRAAEARGLYHVAGPGACSRADLAEAILSMAPDASQLLTRTVERIASASLALPAARPAYSPLDASKLGRELGIVLPLWQEQLAAYLRTA
jgi:dTDP-4-dehydrorhamnose reductase